MTKNSRHLTQEQRCQIYAQKESGKSHREIAKLIECSHTTINKEVKRNKGKRGYRSIQAHQRAVERRANASSSAKKLTPEIISKIELMLKETQASPVQVAGRLKAEHQISISHETIYTYIWKDKKHGGALYTYLRRRAKKYNKRCGKNTGRGVIPHRVDISERPAVVEEKRRVGDFELDTIIGKGRTGALVSIVDRATKYLFLRFVSSKTADAVTSALVDALHPLAAQKLVHTLTSDNGKEFATHQTISARLGASFYFARPYHSWQRGLNEHTNGLIRQYFPKGTDFSTLTHERVRYVEQILNNRPRKVLSFYTPREIFSQLTSVPLCGNSQT